MVIVIDQVFANYPISLYIYIQIVQNMFEYIPYVDVNKNESINQYIHSVDMVYSVRYDI